MLSATISMEQTTKNLTTIFLNSSHNFTHFIFFFIDWLIDFTHLHQVNAGWINFLRTHSFICLYVLGSKFDLVSFTQSFTFLLWLYPVHLPPLSEYISLHWARHPLAICPIWLQLKHWNPDPPCPPVGRARFPWSASKWVVFAAFICSPFRWDNALAALLKSSSPLALSTFCTLSSKCSCIGNPGWVLSIIQTSPP